MMLLPSGNRTLVWPLIAAIAIACADGASSPIVRSPLDGLVEVGSNDSVPGYPPPQPAPTPGTFHGVVRGYEPGPDSGVAPVKLADVRVTAYERVSMSTDSIGVGTVAASVQSDANGDWQLPTLPGGEYVVTFDPPSGSRYRGVWTVATAYSGSNDFRWFVMLPVK
jgi:hypothetical protein